MDVLSSTLAVQSSPRTTPVSSATRSRSSRTALSSIVSFGRRGKRHSPCAGEELALFTASVVAVRGERTLLTPCANWTPRGDDLFRAGETATRSSSSCAFGESRDAFLLPPLLLPLVGVRRGGAGSAGRAPGAASAGAGVRWVCGTMGSARIPPDALAAASRLRCSSALSFSTSACFSRSVRRTSSAAFAAASALARSISRIFRSSSSSCVWILRFSSSRFAWS